MVEDCIILFKKGYLRTMLILCKNTCISKEFKDPKKKPKFRKFTDTFIDAFDTPAAVVEWFKNKIVASTPKERIHLDTYKDESLRRKYDGIYLKNVILFSVIIEDKDIKSSHMYFLYYKPNPLDTSRKEVLTRSKAEFKYIESKLKKVLEDNEEA